MIEDILKQRRKEFNELTYKADFQPRNHSCEGWNGLGDEEYGKALLEEEYRKNLLDFQEETVRMVVEEICKELQKTQKKYGYSDLTIYHLQSYLNGTRE